ncbi:MAG: deoxyguanosinetriphosphate triphosphohydrolase [Syntrophomonadaceae bacterium]|nr:deoxyguanosinetriphosphate triphosphohydrolase [Syntrophomonadaceae bacterium]
MNIREEIEKREDQCLAPYAVRSKSSRGRELPENMDPVRTCFMVDRDRIIHSKSFRRLKHKTQVFIAPGGDHYRTRLTHTLEVNQIARTIGAGLNLNQDLIEAIALAHDVGHTPFAHAGERVLDRLLKEGFKHDENSVRVLTKIERHHTEAGLNLSWEVLDGVLRHSGYGKEVPEAASLEGQVVKISDKIAYVQHDIDDSIRAGILKPNELPRGSLKILGESHSQRIATLVISTIEHTAGQIKNNDCLRVAPHPEINTALKELRQFMFEKVYNGDICRTEREKAMFIINNLYNYYCLTPDQMTLPYQQIAEQEGVERAVADYISGMSDAYCMHLFKKIFLPQVFMLDD